LAIIFGDGFITFMSSDKNFRVSFVLALPASFHHASNGTPQPPRHPLFG